MNDETVSGYLTSEEAARALGVKRATLYTYVSRGMIRIVPAADSKRRLYLASDVEALRTRSASQRGHAAAAASSMGWGAPILESAITHIDIDGPAYRGHTAIDLMSDAGFESVAHLLWADALPAEPPGLEANHLGVDPDALAAVLPEGTPPLEVLAAVVPLLAAGDPLRFAATEAAEILRAGRLVRRLAASLALAGERTRWRSRLERALDAPTIARALSRALGGPEAGADLIDGALIACADHELNASAFAARVAASTGADLLACVSAALAALSGPRHGGVTDRVEALVDEAGSPSGARRMLGARFARGETVPGFGHRLYPDGDPRGRVLLERVRTRAEVPERAQTLLTIVEAMGEAGHPPPTLDVGLVATCAAAGLPRGSGAALFAVGRCAGWIAHAREQAATGELLRPRARYVGP